MTGKIAAQEGNSSRTAASGVIKRGWAAINIIRHIRECLRAKQALWESQERFRSAFEHASIGMALTRPDGRLLQVNPSFSQMLGYSEQELTSKTWQAITHPDDLDIGRANMGLMLAREMDSCQFEKRYFHNLGHAVWSLLSFSLVRDADGNPLYFIAQIQDITDRKRAEEELQDRTTQLQAISEAMTTYLDTGNWHEASAVLLRSALSQTDSEYGFVGVIVEGPVLRILAHEGIIWDATLNRELYDNALRTYQEGGYLEFTSFDNLFGKVITEGKTLLTNEPAADPRSGGLPPGHPTLRHFLGVPIFRGSVVVGIIGVANRPGGYSGEERGKIEILTRAAGVLYENYRQRQREAALEVEGKRMEEALQKAREELEGRVERQMLRRNQYGLTFRELTVLHLVGAGKSDKEIGTELGISPLTAQKHVSNILTKMDATSRAQAGVRAVREGLLG